MDLAGTIPIDQLPYWLGGLFCVAAVVFVIIALVSQS